MTSRRFLAWLLLVGAAAAVLRFAHLASIGGTPLHDFPSSWTSSDMYVHRAWAEHLAGGDWLDRQTFRPRFDWMANVADEATWQRWLGPKTYYQPPLYVYLLALGIKVTGGPDAFRWLQALLGAANVVLIGLLGRRVAGPAAGIIAALFAAGFAPFIFYDGELLRGTLALTLGLLALLALHAASAREVDGGGAGFLTPWRRSWILAGAALGAAYCGDSAVVTFIPLAFLWAFLGAAPRWQEGALRAGWMAAGTLAALLPLMARNVAVGAPILSTTTRAPLSFVMGNAPGAKPVGAAIPESAAAILHASDYRMFGTIRETLRAHHGDIGAIASMQFQKLQGLFNSYEVPDNPSFDYAALDSPVLRWGMRFSCVAGLGLVGLMLGARRPRAWGLIHLYVLAVLSLFLMAHVVSRYRQPLVIPLAIGAGAALSEAGRALRQRRALAAAAIVASGAAISFALPSAPPAGYRHYRPAEFLAAASQLESRGDVARAAAEIKRALVLAQRENAAAAEKIDLGLALAELNLKHERFPEALSACRDVLDEDPRNIDALVMMGGIYHDTRQPMPALETLLRAQAVDPKNAEVQARLGHLYWFVSRDAEKALEHLRRAIEIAPDAAAAPALSALAAQIAAETARKP